MTIHKEGRTLLLVLFILLSALNIGLYYYVGDGPYLGFVIAGSALLYFAVLQFFRHPRIVTPVNPNHVIAPADGKVVVIEETEETEFLNEKRLQVSIFMSPINVHVNRMPVQGIIEFVKYHAGKYLVAWHPKSSTENERTTISIKMANGVSILMRQIAGAMARRIKWYVEEGQQLQQGQEFGFIKFGSRVDLYLPLDAKMKVKIGDKTQAGVTVLAELNKA